MIKVFSPNKVIYLINDQKLFVPKGNRIIEAISSVAEMRSKYDETAKNNIAELYFFNKDEKKLVGYFTGMFKIINAAGGFVQNDKEAWLFIFRNGKWDLPKGKIEKDEKIKTAAKREVEEECGIKGLTILKKLPPTYHVYLLEGQEILKRTYWFEMRCTDNSPLVPQKEEGITDVKWIPKSKFPKILANTYDSVKDVIRYQI